jgi:hypothetical protein
MTNFQFYRTYWMKYLYILHLPNIEILNNRDDDELNLLKAHREAVAYYSADENKIKILKEFDCLAIRIHEYGHWANERLRLFLDAVWEFPWWGLGIRSFFVKKKETE